MRTLPSYRNGYARNAAESDNPNLFAGLLGAWVPALGSTGPRLNDAIRRSSHGTLTSMGNDRWKRVNGLNCLEFGPDGTGTIVNGDRISGIKTEHTVVIWLRITSYDGSGTCPFGGTSPTNLSWQIYNNTGVHVANRTFTTTSFAWADSQWHCACFRATNTLASMHADGVQIGSAASPTVITRAARNFGIGNRRDQPMEKNELFGNIASVYVYDRAISNDEIVQHASDVFAPLRQRDKTTRFMFPEQAAVTGSSKKFLFKLHTE